MATPLDYATQHVGRRGYIKRVSVWCLSAGAIAAAAVVVDVALRADADVPAVVRVTEIAAGTAAAMCALIAIRRPRSAWHIAAVTAGCCGGAIGFYFSVIRDRLIHN